MCGTVRARDTCTFIPGSKCTSRPNGWGAIGRPTGRPTGTGSKFGSSPFFPWKSCGDQKGNKSNQLPVGTAVCCTAECNSALSEIADTAETDPARFCPTPTCTSDNEYNDDTNGTCIAAQVAVGALTDEDGSPCLLKLLLLLLLQLLLLLLITRSPGWHSTPIRRKMGQWGSMTMLIAFLSSLRRVS